MQPDVTEINKQIAETTAALNVARRRLTVTDRGNAHVQPKLKLMWVLTAVITIALVGVLLIAMRKTGWPLIWTAVGLTAAYAVYYAVEAVRTHKDNKEARFGYELAVEQADRLAKKRADIFCAFVSENGGVTAKRVDRPALCGLWRQENVLFLALLENEVTLDTIDLGTVKAVGTTASLISRRIVFEGETDVPLTRIVFEGAKDVTFTEEDEQTIKALLPELSIE